MLTLQKMIKNKGIVNLQIINERIRIQCLCRERIFVCVVRQDIAHAKN